MEIDLEEEFFIMEKTSDCFKLVKISYDDGQRLWSGAFPKYLKFQGLDLTEIEFNEKVELWATQVDPILSPSWINESDKKWTKKDTNKTYRVLESLYSGEWECRVCGPVPKVNPQPAARIKALKQKGYTICSKRKKCDICEKKTMHDILIMISLFDETSYTVRSSISDDLKHRIIHILGSFDVAMYIKRTHEEFVIDHKFPSQRWSQQESTNHAEMTDDAIRSKFQLLTNQSNMMKSRACDECVKTGVRGSFMGIEWYYHGNKHWDNTIPFDSEKGCVGCPWYDLKEWRFSLHQQLKGEDS